MRHYITNILPNDFKAQVVATSRELAVQYVDELKEARDEIVTAIERAADILKNIDLEAAQEAGGDVAFMVAAFPYLDAIKRLEFAERYCGLSLAAGGDRSGSPPVLKGHTQTQLRTQGNCAFGRSR